VSLAMVCYGCGSKGDVSPQKIDVGAPKVDSQLALKLDGPGGVVGLGDDFESAKKAFPAPKDAQVFETSLSFAIIAPKGWAWMVATAGNGFEAAEKGGKVAALSRTLMSVDKSEPAKTIAKIGEPTRKAEGKTAKMYVWERGDQVRFWFNSSGGLLGSMTVTLIGTKEDLKLLNYRADDPETFVRQLDMAVDQAKSLEPVFKEAKEKAKKKAGT
jgi:hypothetical protein